MVHDPSVVLVSNCVAWTEMTSVQLVTRLWGMNWAGMSRPRCCPKEDGGAGLRTHGPVRSGQSVPVSHAHVF